MATEQLTATRRCILGGIVAAPITLAALPALARTGDADITRAWNEWLAAQRLLYSKASRESDEVFMSASDRVDAAEDVIMKASATTSRGILAKLLISLPHMQNERWVEEAIITDKIQTLFDREAELDFPSRLVVQAVRSLQKKGH